MGLLVDRDDVSVTELSLVSQERVYVCIVGTNVCFSYIKVGECGQHQHQCSTVTVCELITLF